MSSYLNKATANAINVPKNLALSDFATGGVIGAATSTVDIYQKFTITQTTAGQTLTLPTPSVSGNNKIAYIANSSSSTVSFTVYGITLSAGSYATFIYDGGTWTPPAGSGGSSPQVPAYTIQGNNTNATGNIANLTADETINAINNGTSTANSLAINRGGTGVRAVTTSPTASQFSAWDANKNLSANNLINGFTTTTTAGGTTTLTVPSTGTQVFTGTLAQTIVLPPATTLVIGQQFYIANESTDSLTLNANGDGFLNVILSGSKALITLLANGTAAGTWSVQIVQPTSMITRLVVAANSFTVGQYVTTGASASGYILARSDVITTLPAIGRVLQATSTQFVIALAGSYLTGLSEYTANTSYVISNVTAGADMVNPSVPTNGQLIQNVFIADSTTSGHLVLNPDVIPYNVSPSIISNVDITASGTLGIGGGTYGINSASNVLITFPPLSSVTDGTPYYFDQMNTGASQFKANSTETFGDGSIYIYGTLNKGNSVQFIARKNTTTPYWQAIIKRQPVIAPLQYSYTSVTTYTVAVGNFNFPDYSGQASLATLVKSLSAWAAGSGNGSLDTGAIAVTTWYYIYAIYNPTTGVSDILLSASPISPILPSGFTKLKRLPDAIKTNASSQITPFTLSGTNVTFNTAITVFSAPSAVTVSTNSTAIPVLKCRAFCRQVFSTTAAGGSSSTIWGNLQSGTLQVSPTITTNNGFSTAGEAIINASDGAIKWQNFVTTGGVTGSATYLDSIEDLTYFA